MKMAIIKTTSALYLVYGHLISSTLFSVFMNDQVKGKRDLNESIDISPDFNVSLLLFGDDIVLLAPNEISLLLILDYLFHWCDKNKITDEDTPKKNKQGKNGN